MSETSLSDYEPDEWDPIQPPVLCCAAIQKISTSPNSVPVRPLLHNIVFQQRGKIPTFCDLDVALSEKVYKWGLVRIVATGGGIQKSRKRWFTSVERKNDSSFVLIPKHKVYEAQRKEQVERKEESGNTCLFGRCPNHPAVEYEATWFEFIREKDPESILEEPGNKNDGRSLEQPPESIEIPEAVSEIAYVHQSIAPSSPIFPAESEQTPPMAGAQWVPQSIGNLLYMSNTHLVQPLESSPYQNLRAKVKIGKGVPCDDCARTRRTCSRRMTPGGPPKCDRCMKRNTPCTWDTVGSGKREGRNR
jgi:hypothetical protein